MSSWAFYNAVRDAMRRMAAEHDKHVEGTVDVFVDAEATGPSTPDTKR